MQGMKKGFVYAKTPRLPWGKARGETAQKRLFDFACERDCQVWAAPSTEMIAPVT